ncbi:4-aminobutyrate--2-oxoglutarate transaminase [Hyphococcus sp. DH-69]|uniref:4-aminobutyrate--2-oxoglutarate transaminase n=1 Tax=Hyphococcus formosus TaxID=3143534 RepID=UPI00398B9CAB
MSVAEIKTAKLPGNAEWQSRKEAAIARGEGNIAPLYVERAEGSEVWDVEGRRFIDFGTGIAVCNTGHRHPKIMKAVNEQLERFSHTCVMVTPYDSAVLLAEALIKIAPGQSPKKSMFVTTGAEAVENAIKIARSHTGRRGVIAFDGGYHGRTLMTLGLTGKVAPYKNRFGPFPGDIWRAPFPKPYHNISVEDSLAAVDMLFKTDIAPEDCAAIIVEPIQGEGGFYPAPNEFLKGLRERCDAFGIVLIIDEIQSGFARTGRLFASEYAGIEPDLMTLAKGLAGGFPLAAVVGKAEIMDAPAPGGLGGTYAGSPIGCAAALSVIDVINDENLTERAIHIGQKFGEALRSLQAEHPDLIGDIRSDRGAMIAIELVHNGNANKPNAELTKAVLTRCYEKGLIVLSCGMDGNVFRFLPALTITDELLDEGISTFTAAFIDCAK